MFLAICRGLATPLCVLLLAWVLTACSTTPLTARPQPRPIGDTTLPPRVTPEMTLRQRIVDIAQQEWRHWGEQTVRVGADGRGCINTSPLPAPPEYLAERASFTLSPCWQFADGTGMETTPSGCMLALRYWHLLGREPDCAQIATSRWAWSAAFISWVLRQAGLTEAQFLISEAHNQYVSDARDGVLPHGAFGVEAWPALPQPGDMVCSARDALVDVVRVEQVVAGRTHMHCDIVIAVDAQRGELRAIGGNVQQAVSLSTISWDAAALAAKGEAIDGDGDGEAHAPWLLVMRNRLQ